MDEDAVWFQNALLTVLHAIEGRSYQEIERAATAKVDAVVLESLAIEIAAIERDGFCPKLDQQPREPRFEHRRALSRRRRAARVRTRRYVKDPLVLDARERSECALQPADEFLDDLRELGLTLDLAPERVALVQLVDSARE